MNFLKPSQALLDNTFEYEEEDGFNGGQNERMKEEDNRHLRFVCGHNFLMEVEKGQYANFILNFFFKCAVLFKINKTHLTYKVNLVPKFNF